MNITFSPPYQTSPDDWRRYKAIRIRAVKNSPGAFGDNLETINSHDDIYWIELIENSQVFVISDNEDYVATASFKQDPDGVWSIKALWTDPKYRGLGLATELLNHIINIAKADGVTLIELGINSDQHSAIELYKNFGFKTIESIPDIEMGDGSKGNLLVMRLSLS
jgi:ribosomal protein S18 acetylase RimI-like enzyme